MTLAHGVNVSIGTVEQAPPPDSPTVIGVVGTGTAGSPVAALNVPVAVHSLDEAITQFGTAGTLFDACEYIFSVATIFVVGVRFDDTLTLAARITAVNAALDALATAETATGHKPTLICAPGETYVARDDGAAQSVNAKLNSIAESLDAIAWADMANSTIAIANDWLTANGGDRLIGSPQVFVTPENAALDGSVFLAGQQAALDAESASVRESLDNRPLSHLSSLAPSYTFSYRHASEAAQLTDGKGAMVVVRHNGVFRAWGGETTYGSTTDPRRFYATQRVLDQIEDRSVEIVVGIIGRGIRAASVPRSVRAVQDYLDGRVAVGDVASAVCTADARNTPVTLAAGTLYLDIAIQVTPQARVINLQLQIR